jgi:hypothetical protein
VAEAADIQGTHPSPARRWVRRTAALLASAPLLAGLVQASAAGPALAAEQTGVRAASGSDGVSVAVDSLSPAAPTDGDTVTVSGTVTNNGKQAVTDAQVGLRVGPRLGTRSEIDTVARNSTDLDGSYGTPLDDDYSAEFPKLTPGVAEHFALSVPVDALDLGDNGVYEFSVTLSGETSAQPWEQVLGVQRTFLPWQPDAAGTKTRTTYLWPLVSTSHVTAETGSNEQQTPVFRNEDLAKEISPGGRLDQLVTLGGDLDVTWVVDPDLLASVDAMTRGYEVRAADGTTTAGRHQAVAKQWLAGLQTAVADKEVVALPFADPDLASLAHNGTDFTGSLSQLKEATDVVANTVEPILHVKPSTDFAWPVEGAVDPAIVKVATSAGADKVIARSDSLKETGGLSYTPSAARPVGGGTTAVVADARLSTAFEGDLTKAATSTAAVQQFLAQSLALDLQTGEQRSVVVAPQRMPTGSQARAMAEALTALEGGDWSQPQDLSDAASAKPDPGATTTIPSRSAYPSALRERELPHEAFEQLARTQDKLDHFKAVLSDRSRVVTPFGRALNREMSTSWRDRAGAARTFRNGVETYLDGLTGQVRQVGDQALRPQCHDPRHRPEQPGAGRRPPGAPAHLHQPDPAGDRRGGLPGAARLGLRRTQPVGEVHHVRQRQRTGDGHRPAVHGGRPEVRRPGDVRREGHRDHGHRDAGHRRRRAPPRPRRLPHVPAAQARRRPRRGRRGPRHRRGPRERPRGSSGARRPSHRGVRSTPPGRRPGAGE